MDQVPSDHLQMQIQMATQKHVQIQMQTQIQIQMQRQIQVQTQMQIQVCPPKYGLLQITRMVGVVGRVVVVLAGKVEVV